MNDLSNRGPMGQKAKRHKDPWYLSCVHLLPCVICEEYGMEQLTPTEAHHPICDRHSQEKVPDREAIPLCDDHHCGHWFNTSRIAIHRERKEWVARYGSDRDYIARTQDRILG